MVWASMGKFSLTWNWPRFVAICLSPFQCIQPVHLTLIKHSTVASEQIKMSPISHRSPPAVCNRKDLKVLSFMHCSPCWASFEKTTRALPPHQPLCAPPLQRQQLHMWENSSGHGRGSLCPLFEFSDMHWLRSDSF